MTTTLGTAAEWHIKVDHKFKTRGQQSMDVEDLPTKDRVRTTWKNDWNHLPKYKSRIKRILEKGVGRRFDDVYKEILQAIKENYRPATWDDIIGCIDWWVELTPMEVLPGVFAGKSGFPMLSSKYYYVCPHSGIMKRAKQRWHKILRDLENGGKQNDARYWKQEHLVLENRSFRKICGIWYEVILSNLPKTNNQIDDGYNFGVYDYVLKQRISQYNLDDLRKCHGIRTYDDRLTPYDKYCKQQLSNPLMIGYNNVYASAIRQLSNSEVNYFRLSSNVETAPQLIRKGKHKHRNRQKTSSV